MFSDVRAVRAFDVWSWREHFAGVTSIAGLPMRELVICVGVVERIRFAPQEPLAVTVDDGTGRLTALFASGWPARRMKLGHGLQLCGTVGEYDAGVPTMVDPAWIAITQ